MDPIARSFCFLSFSTASTEMTDIYLRIPLGPKNTVILDAPRMVLRFATILFIPILTFGSRNQRVHKHSWLGTTYHACSLHRWITLVCVTFASILTSRKNALFIVNILLLGISGIIAFMSPLSGTSYIPYQG